MFPAFPQTAVVSPFSRRAEAAPSPDDGSSISCRIALRPEERAIHMEIRRRIFVEDQKFFQGSDADEYDARGLTVHVLGLQGSTAGGAVRLYPLEQPGVWKGDRLAVLPHFRRLMGARLVRFAVYTAGLRGGDVMIAHVQPPNVTFFRHLGWTPQGDIVQFKGHPHQKMAIPLSTPF